MANNTLDKLNFLSGNTEEDNQDRFNLSTLAGPINPVAESTNVVEKDEDFFKHISIRNNYNVKNDTSKSGRPQTVFDQTRDTYLLDDSNDYDANRVEYMKNLLSSEELLFADELDAFLTGDFSNDEDSELRNELISIGRKYARDNSVTQDNSEINKAFADSESRFKNLYEGIEKDVSDIQRDMDKCRLPQRGNSKILADLASVKKGLRDSQIKIVSEINNMRVKKLDLKAKDALRKKEESGDTDINANTIRNIFSSAKSNIINSMGGYSSVVDNNVSEDDEGNMLNVVDDDTLSDELIQRKYFSNDNRGSYSDGDKFLEYEDRNISYVLILDEDKIPSHIIAEDEDGTIIPDYPLPSNFDELKFDINEQMGVASDSLHRKYNLRFE